MSRHKCSKDLYATFLQVTSGRYSALSLSEVSPVDLSHDAISRWLTETHCRPKDIWQAQAKQVVGTQGVLIADETVINKSRSDKISIARWQYSGNVHGKVKGIGVLNFIWVSQDDKGKNIVNPIDFRIWEPVADGQTKNDQFREMLKLVKQRELAPEAVVADSWYSSLDNTKCIRDMGWFWVMGLKRNRLVNKGERLDSLDIPDEGISVHLRGYGFIKVFRFVSKHGRTDYIGTNIKDATRDQIKVFLKKRWEIEVYHRELKQTCGLECCQSRTSRAQRNHIALSILAWVKHAKLRRQYHLSFYRQQWNTIKTSVAKQLKHQMAIT